MLAKPGVNNSGENLTRLTMLGAGCFLAPNSPAIAR